MLDKKFSFERRKTRRLNIPIKVRYKQPRERAFNTTSCENISGLGMKLTRDYPLKNGERLKVLLYLPADKKKPIKTTCRVIWCKKSTRKEKPKFDIGLCFGKMNPKDEERFIVHFCELMVDYYMRRGSVKERI